jgi:hypothetical protein
MIRRKTVFVLGAGAHVPYGLLDGGQLMARVLGSLPTSLNGSTDFAHYYTSRFPSAGLRVALLEFQTAMDLGGHTSIDSFLATHGKRPGFTEIGKHAVAYQLLPLEFKHDWIRRPHLQDWMTYFFEIMLTGCLNSTEELLAYNPIDFVTFNYDRTLEDFLCTRIANTYNLSPDVAWEKAQKFKIVHVYGSLGKFDPAVIGRKRTANVRDPLDKVFMDEAVDAIQLMYEQRAGHSGVADAIALLTDAPYVCFLGFGFDPDNITRLELNKCCQGKDGVYSTRYNIPDGDWSRIQQRMSPVTLNQSAEPFNSQGVRWDALEFLHRTAALG